MLRSELLSQLRSVSSALGEAKSSVPAHPCLCFTGEKVFAFDGIVGITRPFPTKWKGGIRGEPILGWLKTVGAKDVELGHDGAKLVLKCGRPKATYSVLAASEFIFEEPDLSAGHTVELDAASMASMKQAAVSMGDDPQHPWRRGMLLSFGAEDVTFYACNEGSAARTKAAAKVPKKLVGKTPLLPPRFVALLLEQGDPLKLIIAPGFYGAKLANGATIYTSLTPESDAGQVEALFTTADSVRKGAVALPKTWWGALRRAQVMLAADAKTPATCTVTEGKLVLSTGTALGASRDSFQIGKHRACEAQLSPPIVQAVEEKVDKFIIAEGPVFVFYGENLTFVAAAGS